jgi:hypothetical protein
MWMFCASVVKRTHNIRQLWKFKHTEFFTLTTDNPISTVSDTKKISSDYGFQVEFTAFSI